MKVLEEKMEKLGFEKYYKIPLVQKISKLTKQPPCVIIAVFLALFVILLFTRVGNFLSNMVVFTIPAFYTFKAIESENTTDDKRLLTFWVVFGFLYFFDQAFSWFFSFIPFYYILRSVLIMFLYNPKYNGAQKIYTHLIEPFLNKYERHIEKITGTIEQKSQQFQQNIKKVQQLKLTSK